MSNNSIFIVIGIIVFLVFGCEDFEEHDLSKTPVFINAPSDKLITTLTSLTFWWDSVPGAQTYNIQIVSKSFIQIENVLVDTIVKKNKFQRSFDIGTYAW